MTNQEEMAMVTRRSRLRAVLAGAVVAGMTAGPDAAAQDVTGERVVPTHHTVISGYGTVGYLYRTQGDNQNEFTASINPIFLFQFQDRILFEAEFEFELEEGITETGLEYAQLDFIAHDNLTLVGGKFLLPFGVFGERLHPTWINKFPTSPPIFGHHVAAFGAEPLIPILSDIGFMARGAFTSGPANLALNLYAVQGPSIEEDGEGEEAIPELDFPASSSDNNTNKLIGGRLDIALPPWAEVNFSYFNGDYDENNVLDFTGWDVAGEYRLTNVELRGEYVQTRQEIETLTGFTTVRRHGFYAQAAYRRGAWEPVFRWTQVFDDKLEGQVVEEGVWQAAFGLDYWFSPSIALMAGFELNREDGPELDNDRFVVHVAYGF